MESAWRCTVDKTIVWQISNRTVVAEVFGHENIQATVTVAVPRLMRREWNPPYPMRSFNQLTAPGHHETYRGPGTQLQPYGFTCAQRP